MEEGIISHQGVVETVTPNKVTVKIISAASCVSCQVKGACSASDVQEKIIDALPGKRQVKPGDWVTIAGKESMGFKALFLGYLLPFLIVFISLVICTSLQINELKGGLISLFMLIPYYGILYLTRNSIRKSFIFEIQ
jgi:sigma-E factor negative regulatory protein RseC